MKVSADAQQGTGGNISNVCIGNESEVLAGGVKVKNSNTELVPIK